MVDAGNHHSAFAPNKLIACIHAYCYVKCNAFQCRVRVFTAFLISCIFFKFED